MLFPLCVLDMKMSYESYSSFCAITEKLKVKVTAWQKRIFPQGHSNIIYSTMKVTIMPHDGQETVMLMAYFDDLIVRRMITVQVMMMTEMKTYWWMDRYSMNTIFLLCWNLSTHWNLCLWMRTSHSLCFPQDRNMSYFVKHGEFPADRREYPGKHTNLIIVCFWSILVAIPFLHYSVLVLSSGSMFPLLVVAVLLVAGTVGLIGEAIFSFEPEIMSRLDLSENHLSTHCDVWALLKWSSSSPPPSSSSWSSPSSSSSSPPSPSSSLSSQSSSSHHNRQPTTTTTIIITITIQECPIPMTCIDSYDLSFAFTTRHNESRIDHERQFKNCGPATVGGQERMKCVSIVLFKTLRTFSELKGYGWQRSDQK